MKSIHDPRYCRVINRIRAARITSGLRQADVARTLGVRRSMISSIETFERRADLLEAHRIAKVCGLQLSDLEPLLTDGGQNVQKE